MDAAVTAETRTRETSDETVCVRLSFRRPQLRLLSPVRAQLTGALPALPRERPRPAAAGNLAPMFEVWTLRAAPEGDRLDLRSLWAARFRREEEFSRARSLAIVSDSDTRLRGGRCAHRALDTAHRTAARAEGAGLAAGYRAFRVATRMPRFLCFSFCGFYSTRQFEFSLYAVASYARRRRIVVSRLSPLEIRRNCRAI